MTNNLQRLKAKCKGQNEFASLRAVFSSHDGVMEYENLELIPILLDIIKVQGDALDGCRWLLTDKGLNLGSEYKAVVEALTKTNALLEKL